MNGLLYDLLTGDFSGFKSGFQEPLSMADGSSYDPDKAYKDSKLVRGVVWCSMVCCVVSCRVVLCCVVLCCVIQYHSTLYNA